MAKKIDKKINLLDNALTDSSLLPSFSKMRSLQLWMLAIEGFFKLRRWNPHKFLES